MPAGAMRDASAGVATAEVSAGEVSAAEAMLRISQSWCARYRNAEQHDSDNPHDMPRS
jgi:hypothetical protein